MFNSYKYAAIVHVVVLAQRAIVCSKLTEETVEQVVKYVQS